MEFPAFSMMAGGSAIGIDQRDRDLRRFAAANIHVIENQIEIERFAVAKLCKNYRHLSLEERRIWYAALSYSTPQTPPHSHSIILSNMVTL
jgi:hypothetical protein